MRTRLLAIQTYLKLGIANLFRVFLYRLRLKTGRFEKELPIRRPVAGEFFPVDELDEWQKRSSDYLEAPQFALFGWLKIDTTSPPDWHKSVLTNLIHDAQHQHWSRISDFDSGVGDIKGVWEPSRFTWVLHFVQNYLASGDEQWIVKSNEWLLDWSANNSANQGANWMCAQETSFRILHLASAALLLKKKMPSTAIHLFLQQHLERIAPTLGYAMAQDNNHGTSEAAALIIGASWLLVKEPDNKQARRWYQQGRKYLENRVQRLILSDGTFSQYSVTYHRLMLDTLSFVELWRRFLALEAFPRNVVDKLSSATQWLYDMVDDISGDAPNLGANDGAHVLNFCRTSYRDFRPSIELGARLFSNRTAYSVSFPQPILALLSTPSGKLLHQDITICAQGGYGLIRTVDAWCCLNAPAFVFRPSHADMLHLDLWLKGENVLRDAGSFSYNAEDKWLDYFPSVRAHNTVEFDQREPMPKLSRFLYANWPQYDCFNLDLETKTVEASYTTYFGAHHTRSVTMHDNEIVITDTLSGIEQRATLRWRLANLDWKLEGQAISSGTIRIAMTCDKSLNGFQLAEGFESRYYGKKSSIPVLETEIIEDAEIITKINWQ